MSINESHPRPDGGDEMQSAFNSRRAAFASRVRARQFTLAPGIFDFMSMKIAERVGFDALYVTGYGVTASQLGLPDAGLASFGEIVAVMRGLAAATTLPLIADADTGFGGLLNIRRTMREYERSGVSAIQIEDQCFPKKCGHTPGRQVVPVEQMTARIQVAVEARSDRDFLIVARTDARSSCGIGEAIDRANAFVEAGADVIFVESPESADEFSLIASAIDAPLLANMVEGGRSPILPADELRSMGFTIAIYPVTALMAAARAMRSAFEHLARTGSSLGLDCPIEDFSRLNELTGFPAVWAFNDRWGHS